VRTKIEKVANTERWRDLTKILSFIKAKKSGMLQQNSNGHVFDSRWVLRGIASTHSSVVERSIAGLYLFFVMVFAFTGNNRRPRDLLYCTVHTYPHSPSHLLRTPGGS
jgi:hypothetical protein